MGHPGIISANTAPAQSEETSLKLVAGLDDDPQQPQTKDGEEPVFQVPKVHQKQ